MSNRANSTGEGRHEYREGDYVITLMGAGQWFVFKDLGFTLSDTGYDFKTLAEARKWAKANATPTDTDWIE